MTQSTFRRPVSGSIRRPLAAVFTALLAAATLGACSRPAPPQEPVRAVKLMTVGVGALQAQVEYAGEVRARVESRLGFRVAGKLVKRHVEPGQRVRPGQLLAELDPQDYQLAVEAARAQVASAATQRDLAAADFKRYQALREQNFISGAELERREASLKAAQATLDQARAQLASQGNQSSYTRLLADGAGVVTAVDAEIGQVVAAGTPVVRVALDGPRDVVFAVPEDKVGLIAAGQDVRVRGWTAAETQPGRVREVAASADPATRTYQVKVALDGTPPALGSTVTVVPQALSHAGLAAIKLPTTALRQEGSGTAVWLYDAASGTVKSQAVQIATADGNEAVVAAGLQPGQQVVAAGVHVLSPGQKVVPYQPRNAPAPAAAAQTPAQPAVPAASATAAVAK